ncbi:MAG TPA: hypothetical protein VG819_03480 [Rhizomicrobium sp.]|jgi:hypothetical protein|nr:hypothetical protein [Rhizomicrobium sp.]
MKSSLNTLLLGGCMVHWPITRTDCARGRLDCDAFGGTQEVHTFGEIFQIVDLLQGRGEVPQDLRKLAHMRPQLRPVPAAERFENLDLVLLGPSSPIELRFRGVWLNRTAIQRHVLAPLASQSEEMERLAGRWVRQGLVGLNKRVRDEAGAKLLENIRGGSAEAELARALIREIEVSRSDIAGGFRRARERFDCPIGVILYIFRYMPDGRAISWPAGFREDVLDSARALDLPVFDPTPHVLRHGVDAAMMPGHSHYKPAFLPVMGAAIVDFAESLCARSRLEPVA